MITSGNLSSFKNSTHNATVMVDAPQTGFEFSLMQTGLAPSFKSANMVTFSGAEGYLFDQSGNFFGGYQSGVPFELEINYDYNLQTFSYYHNGSLMANSLDITGSSVFSNAKINLIMFNKHGESSLSLRSTGCIS